MLMSQGYDGASVMSGCCSGVQARIKEVAPQAIYVHCNAHCLNLALVDCVKFVREASKFFALLETLFFLSSTKSHSLFLQQQEIHPNKQHRQLQRLVDTRWACRHDAVSALCYTYDAVLATLAEVVSGSDAAKAAEGRGLLLQVKSFRFVLCLVIFDRVLSITKSLSDVLQGTQLNLAKAADLVAATVETLEKFRSDCEWDKVFLYSESVAKLHNLAVNSESTICRTRRPPKRFDEGILYDTTGARETDRTSETYKINLYYLVIDTLLSELKRRFTDKNKDMRALQACNPTASNFLDPDCLEPLTSTYGLDSVLLRCESPHVKQTLSKKKKKSLKRSVMYLN